VTVLALVGGRPTLDRATHRRWPILGDAERQAVLRVLDRGVLSGADAPETAALEEEFGRWVKARYCLLTHSGTSALQLALAAAGVGEGDHVLVPAYSFVATALAVLNVGAIPIFVDVDRHTGLLDVACAAAAVTTRTKAIMPVHVHGCPADLDGLLELASRRSIRLIEDAAQAHGAEYRGRPVGAQGDAGGFSLQSSKNLSAGEGGLFVTNHEDIAERALRLRSFGQNVRLRDRGAFSLERPLDGSRPLESLVIGGMYRGSELVAALARAELAQLPERTERCARNAERLSRALAELPGVTVGPVPPDRRSVHHKLRVHVDPAGAGVDIAHATWRDAVAEALRAEGLEVVAWQDDVLPAQRVFQDRTGFGRGFPWSTDRETDFATLYRPDRFPGGRALLEGSFVLFSQSCPLIAQDDDLVDRYAEAFARVWSRREDLAQWARTRRERQSAV
jgi:dTDP-4-amino-4,6-dideoxygalactose transaminase